MSELVTIEETILGEWWWIAVICDEKQHENLPKFERVKVSDRNMNGYSATPVSDALGELGTITIEGDTKKNKTLIRIETPEAYQGHWRGVLAAAKSFAEHAKDLRRWTYGATPEEAIEHYYRSRAAGSKITLGKIAEAIGMSEKRLRNIKVEYDKAKKWGSKKKS